MVNSSSHRQRNSPRSRLPHPISVMLYQAGTTPAKVAQDLGVTAALISRVINEETVSARVTQRLEQILNKPWADIVAEARAVADRRGASAA